ncbi:fanconi-associated nuclease 1 homolog [Diachasma alloeum]|uniref:fanconi-associated nuclease 1 homolog n=1 Tax=Diachasma alloeum TaxID=454923 RepID=UPI0007383040|nr:fanconi-associated nuclease 1 homolog [Diachasma alloeum]
MNYGYFNEEERSFVFNILTLRKEEQYFLMVFLLKSGGDWFFAREQHYDKLFDVKIHEELFPQMLEKGFLESAYNGNDETFFNLFDDTLLQDLYRMTKRSPTKCRRKMISVLTEMLRQEMIDDVDEDPRRKPLNSYLYSRKGPILKVSPALISLAHRILTLYYPDHNPHDDFSDVFVILTRAFDQRNPTRYPAYSISHFPLFRNRQSLIDYVEAKLIATTVLKMIEGRPDGHIERIYEYGDLIHRKLQKLIIANADEEAERKKNHRRSGVPSYPAIPFHIQQFLPAHLLSKILISIMKFLRAQKTQRSLATVRQYRAFLLENHANIPVDCFALYNEAIAIEKDRAKAPQRAAAFILDALSYLENHRLFKNSRLHFSEIRNLVNKIPLEKLVPLTRKSFVKILAKNRDFPIPARNLDPIDLEPVGEGNSRSWRLKDEDDVHAYERLKEIALHNYIARGFPKVLQCCESLPVTIFACLFWKELFGSQHDVPGAFVSKFQKGPLDLFNASFYENRELIFAKRLKELEMMKDDDIWNLMAKVYRDTSSVESIISHHFGNHDDFKGMIKCLRKTGVLGICKKMIKKECIERGFPDIIGWDERNMGYRIVVVRIPRGNFSAAQNLWIEALINMNMLLEIPAFRIKKG